ncbi:ROK family glucokinase [Ammoniphilus resinae]|uniref:Glucokinase n=1 Tax=Ammoniphilus resinae TaxID=861532 RepID=A0ABS4GL98_9BACL|nr:glucokinase [Ammoniphilus resinae]
MGDRYLVGIDLGGTAIKMGICTIDGQILGELERPTPKGSYVDVLKTFRTMVDELLQGLGLTKNQLTGIGVGVPAFLDVKKGFVYEIVNLGWKNVSLKEELEKLFQLPCYVDNDANTAALGEMWLGAGRGSNELICLTIGTGIGGGLILNGHIYHGAIGMAGEIGHLPVRPVGGRPCNCGGHGCLETETSASAMVYYAKEAATKPGRLKELSDKMGTITAKDVIELAKQGDPASIQILDQVSYYLGLSLAQLANVLNPQKIIIGGGVSKAGHFLLDRVRTHFIHFAIKKIGESTEIVTAELGNQAGWLGAARLVQQRLE